MQKYKPLFKYQIKITNKDYWFEIRYQTNSFLSAMRFLAHELRKNKHIEIVSYYPTI